MYVKKFEGNTLDETLSQVKAELGPEAIILKTKTHKGIGGAFKKKRIEITAAISQEEYLKKARLDRVLNESEKEKLYRSSAKSINKVIERYEDSQASSAEPVSGYQNIAVNRAVRGQNQIVTQQDSGVGEVELEDELDKFLSGGELDDSQVSRSADGYSASVNQRAESEAFQNNRGSSTVSQGLGSSTPIESEQVSIQHELLLEMAKKIEALESQVDRAVHANQELEEKLKTSKVEEGQNQKLSALVRNLRALDISDILINKIIRKTSHLENLDQVSEAEMFEQAVEVMSSSLKIDSSVFDFHDSESLYCFVSLPSSGQSSLIRKLALKCDNALVIDFCDEETHSDYSFIDKFFELEIKKTKSLNEVLQTIRENYGSRPIFLDVRLVDGLNEFKSQINAIKRSFSKTKTILNISSIHSYISNRNVIGLTESIIDGITISFLDLCIDFSALINLQQSKKDPIPMTYFSTGSTIPKDIEVASIERILGTLLKL